MESEITPLSLSTIFPFLTQKVNGEHIGSHCCENDEYIEFFDTGHDQQEIGKIAVGELVCQISFGDFLLSYRLLFFTMLLLRIINATRLPKIANPP